MDTPPPSRRLLYNPGAAFSIGSGSTWVFTVLAAVALTVGAVLLMLFSVRSTEPRPAA